MAVPAIAGTATTMFGSATSISQGGPYCCEVGECDVTLEFSVTTPQLYDNSGASDSDCGKDPIGDPLACSPCETMADGSTVIVGNGVRLAPGSTDCLFQSAEFDAPCDVNSLCAAYPVKGRWDVEYSVTNSDCLKYATFGLGVSFYLWYNNSIFPTQWNWNFSQSRPFVSGDLITLTYASGSAPVSNPGVIPGYRCWFDALSGRPANTIDVEIL